MNRTLRNKAIYLVLMALLLVPLSWLGQPATVATESDSSGGSSGGTLAQLRAEYDLSHGNLGEIDPTSEALKLALFGMRGLAATITWEQAREYQMKEDWTNLDLKLEQIARLQPHFVMVWRHQAWNLSYNVSAEWDDYRDRYYWVIRGLKYLMRGQPYNRHDTRLVWDEGWFIGQKIGKSDEYRQFRILFRENAINPIHPEDRPARDEDRDNWQVARQAFLRGLQMYERGDELRGANPLIFFSEPSRCSIRFAAAKEEEGDFEGDRPRSRWERAREEWHEFTHRSIPAAGMANVFITVAGFEEYAREQAAAEQEFYALQPGLQQQLEAQKRAALTDEERQLLETPADSLSDEQIEEQGKLRQRIQVTLQDFINALPEDKRPLANELAKKVNLARSLAQAGSAARYTVNYDYWEKRCEAEQSVLVRTVDGQEVVGVEQSNTLLLPIAAATDEEERETTIRGLVGGVAAWNPSGEIRILTPNGDVAIIQAEGVREVIDLGVGARRDLYHAYQAYRIDPFTAKPYYETAFQKWRKILDAYPVLVGDGDINDDLTMASRRYDVSLQRRNLPFPKDDYILNDVLEARPPDPPIGE